jgi:AraC family transcriptional regulator
MALEQLRHDPTMGVEELARTAGSAPAQFRRAFRRRTGLLPESTCRRIVSKRTHLLESTDLPVRVVAAQCGFTSTSHFIQFFKRAQGSSPAQYRQSTFNAHL